MDASLDRAHAILYPFRFGLPPVTLVMASYGAERADELRKQVEAEARKTIANLLPANATQIEIFAEWDAGIVDNAIGYGAALLAGSRDHIRLLQTAAGWAGGTLPNHGVANVSERWYWSILQNGRFGRLLVCEKGDEARICSDAMAATWTLLTETSAAANGKDTQPSAMSIDLRLNQIRYGGACYDVTADGALLVNKLVEANDWFSASSIFSKPSEVLRSLPDPIKKLIETQKGKGYRLKLE